jgi:hypothetical protein
MTGTALTAGDGGDSAARTELPAGPKDGTVPSSTARTRRAMSGSALARLRDDEDRALFAIRRRERRLAAEHALLERRLRDFEERLHRTELGLEAQWRRQHWGRDPERPPAWRTQAGRPPDRSLSSADKPHSR